MVTRAARPLALALLALSPPVAGLTAADTSHVQPRLELQLIAVPTLSEAARTAMMKEATAIWRAHGVWIESLPAVDVRSTAGNRLRVMVVDRRPSESQSDKPFTVGELVRPSNGQPVAMISIESAQRLLASVRGRQGYDLLPVDQQRLGLVLGRALAHEIGHYLLDTHTHARDGLMRPQFNALEFTERGDRTFALDRLASEWLKARMTANTDAQRNRFAYAH